MSRSAVPGLPGTAPSAWLKAGGGNRLLAPCQPLPRRSRCRRDKMWPATHLHEPVRIMKVHIAWLAASVIVAVCLAAVLLFQNSWIPDYGEAEPLHPIVAAYGRRLAEIGKNRDLSASDLESVMKEPEFEAIRNYGVVFSSDPEVIASIRVNDTISFSIRSDGGVDWIKKD